MRITFPVSRAVLVGVFGLFLGGAAGAAPAGEAAVPPAKPIGELLRARDARNLPLALGQTVTVAGVITRAVGLDERHDDRFVNIEDGSGGIRLLARPASLLEGFERGDLVRARGELYHWRGNETIRLKEISRLGSAPQPAPREASVRDVASERFSSQVVRVTGELRLARSLDRRSGGLRVRDESGQIIVTIPPSL